MPLNRTKKAKPLTVHNLKRAVLKANYGKTD